MRLGWKASCVTLSDAATGLDETRVITCEINWTLQHCEKYLGLLWDLNSP